MRNSIYLLLCIFWISCGQRHGANDQSPEEEGNNKVKLSIDTDSNTIDPTDIVLNPISVAEIKQTYAATIVKLQSGSLDSASFEYNCNNERKGTITYFTDNGKLNIIKHTYNEYDHYSATDQYFVSDSSLFFVLLTSASWGFVSEGVTEDKITEKRLYIVKQNPILCLEKKYTKRSDSPDQQQELTSQNKEVKCEANLPNLKDFNKLVAFKDNPSRDCL